MKALSLIQPWAHAVVHLGKRVENRDWRGCSFRGPLLIHASKGVGTIDDFDSATEAILHVANPAAGIERMTMVQKFAVLHDGVTWRPSPDLPRGGIVGRGRVDGVIRNPVDFAAYAKRTSNGDHQRAWWFGGFALVLTEIEPLPFVPMKGALGFFHVDDAWLAEQLRARGAA